MGDVQPLLELATSSHPKGTPITSPPCPALRGQRSSQRGTRLWPPRVCQARPRCLHCTRPPGVHTEAHGHHCEGPREQKGGSWEGR